MNRFERNCHNSHLPPITSKELQKALYGKECVNVRKFPPGWSGGNIRQLLNSAQSVINNPGGEGHPRHQLSEVILAHKKTLIEKFG